MSMSIEQYRQELEKQAKVNRDLRRELPALREQNKMLMEALAIKEKEMVALLEQKKNVENRWKNQAKEPYKFTAKPILNAL